MISSLLSSLEVSRFFGSSIDLLIGFSGSAGVAVSSEFRGKASFLPALPGGTATAASDEDFNRSTVFFSSSIDSLIGSFRACFFLIFFFLISSSLEDDGVEPSDSRLDDGTLFFFFFVLGVASVSDSDSDDESDESESKGSERFFFFCFFCSNLSMSEPFVNQFKGGLSSIIPDREVPL